MYFKHCDAYKQRFDRALLTPTEAEVAKQTELFHADRAAFDRLASDAWYAKDYRTVICLGRVAEAHGELWSKGGHRLWHACLRAGELEDAHRLVTTPRYTGPRDGIYLTAMRDLWVGLGRLDRAREIIEARVAAGDRPDQRDEMVLEVEALERQFDPEAGWAGVAYLMGRFAQLGLYDRAARILQLFLSTPRKLAADERDAAIDACTHVFTFIRPDLVPKLLRQAAQLFEEAGPERQLAKGAIRLIGGLDHRSSDREGQSSAAARYCIASAYAAAGLHEAAIELLGELTVQAPKTIAYRNAIAYSVGEYSLRRDPLVLEQRRKRKIFDVFSFNGEREVLAIKLAETADWVDHFVVVETKRTFTGAPKPALLPECRDLLERYGHKIIHVLEEDFPACMTAPWAREFHQRQRGVAALSGRVAEDDLVMISDADEIADRRVLLGFEGQFASLRMDNFRYYLNSRQVSRDTPQHRKSVVVRGRHLPHWGAGLLRNTLAAYHKHETLREAGWHFTCMGDAERMVEKMRSSTHQEYSHRGLDHYSEVVERAREGRLKGWARCELDELPRYVRENSQHFAELLL